MMSPSFHWTDIMAANDRGFFVALGKRVAQLRKDQGGTQQTLAHYEGVRLRLPASRLPHLARIFEIAVETVLAQASR